jgi:hypothetical protein
MRHSTPARVRRPGVLLHGGAGACCEAVEMVVPMMSEEATPEALFGLFRDWQ